MPRIEPTPGTPSARAGAAGLRGRAALPEGAKRRGIESGTA